MKIKLCTVDDINHPHSLLLLMHICMFKHVNKTQNSVTALCFANDMMIQA